MATQAPTAPEKKPAAKKAETPEATSPQPPEDTIWTRYSPHGEMQLSGAGSFALHALGIGLFLILGIYIYGNNKAKELPVEAVRLGGGKGIGTGQNDGVGDGSDREDGKNKGDGAQVEGPKEDVPLMLNPDQIKVLQTQFKDDPNALRAIQKGHVTSADFAAMSEAARKKLRSGIPGGNNGTGEVGKAGGSDGDGGTGPGGKRSDQQKENERWSIPLNNTSPAALLDQLASMGAFIGVPSDGTYHTIRNLRKRPAKLINEDPRDSGQLPWTLENGADPAQAQLFAQATMAELKVNLRPRVLQVYFPPELRQKFRDEETRYLLSKGLSPRQVSQTLFRLNREGDKLVPVAFNCVAEKR